MKKMLNILIAPICIVFFLASYSGASDEEKTNDTKCLKLAELWVKAELIVSISDIELSDDCFSATAAVIEVLRGEPSIGSIEFDFAIGNQFKEGISGIIFLEKNMSGTWIALWSEKTIYDPSDDVLKPEIFNARIEQINHRIDLIKAKLEEREEHEAELKKLYDTRRLIEKEQIEWEQGSGRKK